MVWQSVCAFPDENGTNSLMKESCKNKLNLIITCEILWKFNTLSKLTR